MKTILILICAVGLSGCAHVMRQDLLKTQAQLDAVNLELALNPEKYSQEELKALLLKQNALHRQCQNKVREIVIEEGRTSLFEAFFR